MPSNNQVSNRGLQQAISAVDQEFGDRIRQAKSPAEFESIWRGISNDALSVMSDHVFPKPAVVRRVKAALRPDYRVAGTQSRQSTSEASEWQYSPDLRAYTSTASGDFVCPKCDQPLTKTGFVTCDCGALWNSWSVVEGSTTKMFAKEVERRDVILARTNLKDEDMPRQTRHAEADDDVIFDTTVTDDSDDILEGEILTEDELTEDIEQVDFDQDLPMFFDGPSLESEQEDVEEEDFGGVDLWDVEAAADDDSDDDDEDESDDDNEDESDDEDDSDEDEDDSDEDESEDDSDEDESDEDDDEDDDDDVEKEARRRSAAVRRSVAQGRYRATRAARARQSRTEGRASNRARRRSASAFTDDDVADMAQSLVEDGYFPAEDVYVAVQDWFSGPGATMSREDFEEEYLRNDVADHLKTAPGVMLSKKAKRSFSQKRALRSKTAGWEAREDGAYFFSAPGYDMRAVVIPMADGTWTASANVTQNGLNVAYELDDAFWSEQDAMAAIEDWAVERGFISLRALNARKASRVKKARSVEWERTSRTKKADHPDFGRGKYVPLEDYPEVAEAIDEGELFPLDVTADSVWMPGHDITGNGACWHCGLLPMDWDYWETPCIGNREDRFSYRKRAPRRRVR